MSISMRQVEDTARHLEFSYSIGNDQLQKLFSTLCHFKQKFYASIFLDAYATQFLCIHGSKCVKSYFGIEESRQVKLY